MSETSKQVTIKIQHKEDLRRFTFPRNGSFLEMEKIVRTIFSFSPSIPLVLKYQDDESDWVTCSSDSELAAAFDFVSPNGILKLLLPFEATVSEVKSDVTSTSNSNVNVTVAEPTFPVPSAPPQATASETYQCPWKGRFQSWKSQKDCTKKDWKQEKKQWKDEKKCQWRQWTPEERAAWCQKKEAWKTQCKLQKEAMKADGSNKCDRKMWKEQKKAWKNSCNGGVQAEAGCCPVQGSCTPSAEQGTCGRGRWGGCANKAGPDACASVQQDDQFGPHAGCKWRGRFVKHVTVPDGTVFVGGASFVKTWRFRNEAKEAWPLGSKLLFVGKNSDQMGGPDEINVGREVAPGEEVDVSVPLVAPSEPGTYIGFWRMADAAGKRFGQRVRVQIQVQGPDTSSSTSSEEEVKKEVVPLYPDASLNPAFSSGHLLAQLEAMGFTDRELNMKLARKHNCDLTKIVKKLMKRQKREAKAARR
jgi:hypothetical protein